MYADDPFEARLRSGLGALLDPASGMHPGWATAPARTRIEVSGRLHHPQRGLLLVAALVILSLAASVALVGQRQDHERHGPPVDPAVIVAGLDRLGQVGSYQYAARVTDAGGPPADVRGTVVNGEPGRAISESLAAGEVTTSIVQIGDQAWVSVGGSAYRRDDNFGRHPVALAFTGTLRSLLEGGSISAEDLGDETRDGQATRHVRAEAALSGSALDAPTPQPVTPRGTAPAVLGTEATQRPGRDSGFAGRVDVWIAASSGVLVGAVLDGTYARSDPFSGSPGAPGTHSETITVHHIDDPANVVEEPSQVSPTPGGPASGDASLAPFVVDAYARLRQLESYQSHVDSGPSSGGVFMRATVTNRPVRAVEQQVGSNVGQFWILVIGDEVWSRGDGEAYVKHDDPSQGPSCGGTSPARNPCTFEAMTDLGAPGGGLERTFIRVGDGEVVNGVPTIHLRSDAGMDVDQLGHLPGTTDVWVSQEHGYLVRAIFDGQGIENTLNITNVNDPANVIRRPAEGPATPTPLPEVPATVPPASLGWQVSVPSENLRSPDLLLGGSKGFVGLPELYNDRFRDVPMRSADGPTWREVPDQALESTQLGALVERADGSLLLIGRVLGCSPNPCGPPDVGGHVWISTDWETWTKLPLSEPLASFSPDDLSVGPHGYVAVGSLWGGVSSDVGPPMILRSADGVSWTEAARFEGLQTLEMVADAASGVVAIGTRYGLDSGVTTLVALTSSDGATWTEHELMSGIDCCAADDLIATADGFLLVGGYGDDGVTLARTSTDGSTWRQSPRSGTLNDIELQVVTQAGELLLAGGRQRTGPGSQDHAAAAWSSADGGRSWRPEGMFALQARGQFEGIASSPIGIVAFTGDWPARDDVGITSRAWFAPLP
ncbi:MAG: hypothetical protein QOH61_1126 [Chloroflexota bacterium]|nr:hypothetical protein [Chloroflexota bacterium]